MKSKEQYLCSEFVDFEGKTHKFVIAAYSEVLPTYSYEIDSEREEDLPVVYDVSGYIEGEWEEALGNVVKRLSIGVAICHPDDEYNEELGKKKALKAAKLSTKVLYSSKLGLINTTMVTALLKQEAEFLKNNPELYIRGYRDKHNKFLANAKLEEEFKNLSESDKHILANFTSDNLIRLAKFSQKLNEEHFNRLSSYMCNSSTD